ncbi:hypothetical protein INR49_020763 [Caranx melampygus]|nr:hypothetical protein INR49_020763 [Caranx melampygus]
MGVGQTEPEVPEDAVGRRVSCGGERATVRYVGPVPPTAGLWLGVEWDDPTRGKHDGSHDGVQYFSCRHSTGGSFLRPGKVSFGVDYLAAVRRVYEIDSEQVRNEEISISDKKLEWGRITERSLESLPSVILSRCEVNGPGADGDIRRTTPNVQWLDLSGTLVSCWEDVSSITKQLDSLEGLQLSNNRLCLTSDPLAHRQAFCNLKILVLNSCELTWPQVLHCAPMWPQLEDLCVEENNITELHRPEDVLQNLRSLSLSSNPLVQDSVLSLSDLPSLEQLSLSNTGLSVIRFDDAAPGTQTEKFPALKKLSLDHNNITEWCVVDELAKLPSLVQFSCREYGAPEEGELKKPEPFALKNQLLRITFVFPDDAERRPIEKKLPASMLVQKVKGLLYRLLKVPAADLKLTYTTPQKVGTEFDIDSDLKTLQFYSIEDGDQVLVRWS